MQCLPPVGQKAVHRMEKLFTNSTSNKGLISKIYKGHRKQDINKLNNTVKNGVQI